TNFAAASGAIALRADGDLLAFSVSEAAQGAGGTDFNQDGDIIDGIAVRVNTLNGSSVTLDVAVDDLEFARRTLFLVVQESRDSVDWNTDGDQTDRVLLYVTSAAQTATFLDTLDASSPIVAIGGTVVYASADVPTTSNTTNLRFVSVASNGAAPSAPTTVTSDVDPDGDGLVYGIHSADDDVVFLVADEASAGDLNGDGDSTDTSVLGVLDAGDVVPTAFSSGVGFAAGSVPTAVPISGGGEYLVAFLADEAQEGASLNDPIDFSPTWAVTSCSGADTDTTDAVLHWFQLTDLSMSTAPVNTGLVGRPTGRALALRSGYVGVISPESLQGTGCDLNGDGDSSDPVFRWVAAQDPLGAVLPPNTTDVLVAVDEAMPGGFSGVVRLSDVWVVVVDEAADGRSSYDTDPGNDRDVVLALNPSNGSPSWNASHTVSNIPVEVSWIAEDPENPSEFFAAITEEIRTVFGAGDLNGDGDLFDSIPTVPSSTTSGSTTLTFPGVTFAAVADNAGIDVEENVGTFRISEASQGSDLNGDGDANDELLMRFSLVNAFLPTIAGTANDIDRTLVDFGPGDARFGAFLTEENQGGDDLNGDGDTSDTVVRFFRLP
ncbi:MAG: hypothetical protein AAFR54_01390, partial [Planctomycetota bacterium]